ncbi:MAG: hypothetical protein MUE85_02505 [Microscillaceae bacterium]|jgi:hypothetical protein|nr:hypothetical protein [Microscillaceae bacterium]
MQNPDNQLDKTFNFQLELDEFGFKVVDFQQATPAQKIAKIIGFVCFGLELSTFIFYPNLGEYSLWDWLQLLILLMPGGLALWYGYRKIPQKSYHYYYFDEEKIEWKRGIFKKIIYWNEVKKIALYADCVEFFTTKRRKCYRIWISRIISRFDKPTRQEFREAIIQFSQKLEIPLELF